MTNKALFRIGDTSHEQHRSSTKRGCLVVLEGIDGCGKSTLAKSLYNHFRNSAQSGPWSEVVLTAEPTHGRYGRELRRSFNSEKRLALEQEYRLFILDRKDHVEQLVAPKLSSGALVICDRYYLSTMAYQGARGMDMEEIRRENEQFAPTPDLAIILEIDVEKAMARITECRGETPNLFEQQEYLEQVAANFNSISAPYIVRVDGSLPPESLTETAIRLVKRFCTS